VRRGLGVVVAAVVFLAITASVWAAPRSVVLEFKGEPGQESRYGTTVEMAMDLEAMDPGSGMQVFSLAPRLTASAVTIGRVLEVAENGDVTMGGRVESFDFSLDVADLHARLAIVGPDGGPPQLIRLPELPIRGVVSKRGKVVAIEGLDALPIPPIPGPEGGSINLPEMMSKMIEKFSQPVFPDRAISVGDTWEWEMTMDPVAMMEMMGTPMPPEAKKDLGAMSFPIKSTSTLVAFEEVNGVECAKIEAVAPWELSMPVGPQGAGGMMLKESGSTVVTTWFDYAAGRKVRETTEMSMTMTMGAGPVTPVHMEMRLSGESELK